jgi:hypothetical protein
MPDEYHGYLQLLLAQLIERHSGSRLRCSSKFGFTSPHQETVPVHLIIPSRCRFFGNSQSLRRYASRCFRRTTVQELLLPEMGVPITLADVFRSY